VSIKNYDDVIKATLGFLEPLNLAQEESNARLKTLRPGVVAYWLSSTLYVICDSMECPVRRRSWFFPLFNWKEFTRYPREDSLEGWSDCLWERERRAFAEMRAENCTHVPIPG
jgi:hypothetical protein